MPYCPNLDHILIRNITKLLSFIALYIQERPLKPKPEPSLTSWSPTRTSSNTPTSTTLKPPKRNSNTPHITNMSLTEGEEDTLVKIYGSGEMNFWY